MNNMCLVSFYWLRGKDDFLLEAQLRQYGTSLNQIYVWFGQVNRKSMPVNVNQYDSERSCLSYPSKIVFNISQLYFVITIMNLVFCFHFTEDERETTQKVHLLLVLRQLNLLLTGK